MKVVIIPALCQYPIVICAMAPCPDFIFCIASSQKQITLYQMFVRREPLLDDVSDGMAWPQCLARWCGFRVRQCGVLRRQQHSHSKLHSYRNFSDRSLFSNRSTRSRRTRSSSFLVKSLGCVSAQLQHLSCDRRIRLQKPSKIRVSGPSMSSGV